ncbi:MAG: pepsin/retropepsin-like aspartic protease family protein [Sphingomonas sp.]
MKRTMIALMAAFFASMAAATPTTVPFDPHRNLIAVELEVRGERLTFLVDTAVTPSVIDLAVARRLGIDVDLDAGQDAEGAGTQRTQVYAARLPEARLGGLTFGPIDAAAFDMTQLSQRYGRPLHGILGDSFLAGRIVLIDYPGRRLTLLERPEQARTLRNACANVFDQPLEFIPDSMTPRIWLDVAGTRIPTSLDTGATLTLELFEETTRTLNLGARLSEPEESRVTGARGDARVQRMILDAPVTLGPFAFATLPVTVSARHGSPETRLANAGGGLFQQMRLLIDYPNARLSFFGDCAGDQVRRPLRVSTD